MIFSSLTRTSAQRRIASSCSFRFALAEWIERNEDIRELRRAALVWEIQVGLDQLDRGECVECKDDAELRWFFDGVKARGREMLGVRKNSAT